MIYHDPNPAFRLVSVEHAALTVLVCQTRTNICVIWRGSVPSATKPRETLGISFRKWFNLISQTVICLVSIRDRKLEVVKCGKVFVQRGGSP